jgi:fumarate reductase subunit D
MIAGLAQLIDFFQPYASFYNDHKALAMSTTVAHVGGMLAGGGLAIATDRAVLRMPLNDARGQRSVLEDLATTHSLVIGSLVVLLASGLMFLAADIKTFAVSPVYWSKMATVFLLLLNGLRLWKAEGRLQKSMASLSVEQVMPEREWRSLRAGAITSLLLWFLIMTLGVILGNS